MKNGLVAILHREQEKCDSSPFLGRRLRCFFARELSNDHTEGTEALAPHDRSRRLRKIIHGRLKRLTTMFVVERMDNVVRDHKEVGGCRSFC